MVGYSSDCRSAARHINEYLATGKLKPDNGGSEGYLSVAQTETLILYLSKNTYRYSGIESTAFL